jgi:hypothetical protein
MLWHPSRPLTLARDALLAALVIGGCSSEATSPSGDVQLQLDQCVFAYQSNETDSKHCTVNLTPTAAAGSLTGVIESVEYVGPSGPLPANGEVTPGLFVYSDPPPADLANDGFGPGPYSWTLYAATDASGSPIQAGVYTVKVRVTYRVNGASTTLEANVSIVVS